MDLQHIKGLLLKHSKNILDNFMKIFLDDFTVYSDMDSHCKSSNYVCKSVENMALAYLNKCALMVFSRMILGFIISKKGRLPDLKKIQAIVNMPPLKNPHQIQVFNGMAHFYKCFIKNFVAIMAPITKLTRKTKSFLWIKEC